MSAHLSSPSKSGRPSSIEAQAAVPIPSAERAMQRVLIYSHDTYGLGHLRRSMRIASAMTESGVARHVLIASGSPQAGSFAMPPGVDVVKMPAVTKDDGGGYRSRTLGIGLDDLAEVRARLVLAAVESFQPDAVLIDHSPVGMHRELLPLLESLGSLRHRPALVLGMREIIDAADLVELEWQRSGAWHHLENTYDAVLVYGDGVVTTTAAELGLAGRLPIPVHHVGYVAPAPVDVAKTHRRMPSIVVTTGGGGDGVPVLEAYLDFLESSVLANRVRSVIVTGPFAEGGPVASMVDRIIGLAKPVEIVRFSSWLDTVLATCDGAVTMAGYNTVAELLAHRVPAVLVPRRTPRVEQWLRATRLASVASFTPVATDELTVDHLGALVEGVLDSQLARDHQLDLGGARATGFALHRIVNTPGLTKEIA
ncbi:MAG: glycosyltransferase family protein [Acidimicrobiia bacterium]